MDNLSKVTRLIVIVVALCAATTASAQHGVSGAQEGYAWIDAGRNQLIMDGGLALGFDQSTNDETGVTVQQLDILATGTLGYRRFVATNIGVGVDVGLFRQTTRTQTSVAQDDGEDEVQKDTAVDFGGLFFASAEASLRLGNDIFFRPGIGAGIFIGNRQTPVAGEDDLLNESTIFGFAGKLQLALTHMTSDSFGFTGGLQAIIRAGGETPEETDESVDAPAEGEDAAPVLENTFLAVDAGVYVGINYYF